jgi:hypothetical protein
MATFIQLGSSWIIMGPRYAKSTQDGRDGWSRCGQRDEGESANKELRSPMSLDDYWLRLFPGLLLLVEILFRVSVEWVDVSLDLLYSHFMMALPFLGLVFWTGVFPS